MSKLRDPIVLLAVNETVEATRSDPFTKYLIHIIKEVTSHVTNIRKSVMCTVLY